MRMSRLNSPLIRELALSGRRLDGRGPYQMRDLSVETGVLSKGFSSSRVILGGTELIVGLNFQTSRPYPDHPGEGVMHTEVHFPGRIGERYPSERENDEAVELSRVVDRGVRHSGIIDMSSLCIIPGEKVWALYIDIQVIDHEGNIQDASNIGTVAALKTARIEDGGGTDGFKELSIGDIPISTTFAVISGALFLDPTLAEEQASDGRLTLTLDNVGSLVAAQLSGGGRLDRETLSKALEISALSNSMTRERLDL